MTPRFERNVAGPFYTTGECLACEAPEMAAPTLLGNDSAIIRRLGSSEQYVDHEIRWWQFWRRGRQIERDRLRIFRSTIPGVVITSQPTR